MAVHVMPPIGLKLEERKEMLQVNQPTEEQTQQEQTRQGEMHKSVKDAVMGDKVTQSILNDLGLSPKAEDKSEEEVKSPIKETRKPIEEESDEVQEDVKDEESNDEESSEEESEEVIPKSKVQKRFDELTAKNKYLEQQIEELKQASIKSEPKDEITKQLEEMSPEQLKAAKLEVRKAQIKSQDDDARLNELLALEDKIDNAMASAPKNFERAQVAAYEKMASKIASSGDIKDMDTAAPKILELAKNIYNQYPLLQKDINGQATALELAANHYKALNSAPGDKTKETELKRQNNNLKRKVTLDTKSGKSSVDQAKLDSLKKAAFGGGERQKVALVKSHPMFNVDAMIPDEFKGR